MKVLKNVKIKAELEITGATLLSIEEEKALPQHLKSYKDWWWLRSPGYAQDGAATVRSGGSVFYYGIYVSNDNFCVRPALKLADSESSDLVVGDRFAFGGKEFEIVSDSLAFCTSDIGYCAFRREWGAKDANLYEASDVRRYVDEWFNNALKLS